MALPKPTLPAETRWTCLDYKLEGPDENQIYNHHFTLRNEDGYVFVVSVACESAAKVKHVVDALRVAQARLVTQGGGKFPGARLAKTN